MCALLCISSKYYYFCCFFFASRNARKQRQNLPFEEWLRYIYFFHRKILFTKLLKIIKHILYIETIFQADKLINVERGTRTQRSAFISVMCLYCPTNGIWSFAKQWFDNLTMKFAAHKNVSQISTSNWTKVCGDYTEIEYFMTLSCIVTIQFTFADVTYDKHKMIPIYKSKHNNQIEWHKLLFLYSFIRYN